ncbi:MAG: hypothetical protein JW795_12850 [Chitinivibrionales bacterium]|nr:hypothetical protein [Chitinivibrionales bacterium]
MIVLNKPARPERTFSLIALCLGFLRKPKPTLITITLCCMALFFGLMSVSCVRSTVAMKRVNSPKSTATLADSLFKTGNYEKALSMYTWIRDSSRLVQEKAAAHYNIAYISLYYNNPKLNFDAALAEFNQFQKLYPSHPRIHDANTFIKILTLLKKSQSDLYGHTDKLKKIEDDQKNIASNLTTLHNAYSNCDSVKDSLMSRIKVLEKAIEKLLTTE